MRRLEQSKLDFSGDHCWIPWQQTSVCHQHPNIMLRIIRSKFLSPSTRWEAFTDGFSPAIIFRPHQPMGGLRPPTPGYGPEHHPLTAGFPRRISDRFVIAAPIHPRSAALGSHSFGLMNKTQIAGNAVRLVTISATPSILTCLHFAGCSLARRTWMRALTVSSM